MLRLTPCNRCGRHVRAGETCCPFCPRAGTPGKAGITRLTQALVIAASSLIAPAALANSDAGDAGDAGYDASSWPNEEAEPLGSRPVPLYGMPSPPRGCRCDATGSADSGLGATAGLTLAVAAVVRKRKRRK